jgi:DNA replication protein DnaD
MISDKLGLALHDKATMGKPLSPKQKEQLAAWYAQQDSAEIYPEKLVDTTTEALRLQIDAALSQVAQTVKTIQKLAEENEAIRLENKAIKLQLAKTPKRQTA